MPLAGFGAAITAMALSSDVGVGATHDAYQIHAYAIQPRGDTHAGAEAEEAKLALFPGSLNGNKASGAPERARCIGCP
jgi:hypothetical protein